MRHGRCPRTSPIRLFVRLVGAALVVAGLAGCSRSGENYGAASPDEALDSAQRMIVNGEAHRLVDLIYAENEQMRSLLNQFGELLGSLQELGTEVERRFPEEIARYRSEAERAAAEGRTSPLLTRLVAAGRGDQSRTFGTSRVDREGLTIDTGSPRGEGRASAGGMLGRPQTESERQRFNDIIKELLVDPYRWLAEGRDKISTVYVSDDTVSLLWEGRPILPPFGMALVQRDDRWMLVPPTSYPGVSAVMPRNDDEWYVWGSMVRTLDHVVQDLGRDVRSGRVKNLSGLADAAVKKVAIPAMLVVFAYSNLVEERQRQSAQEAEARREAGSGEADAPEPAEPESSPSP